VAESNAQFLNAVISLSMGLAALVSLVSIFRTPEKFEPSDIVEFKSILISCMAIAIGGLIPFIIGSVYSMGTIWSIASLAYSVVALLIFIQVQTQISRGRLIVRSRITSFVMRAATIASIFLTFLNGLFFHESSLYLAALFWSIALTIIRLYLFLIIAMHFPNESQ
jgi:hypothetical protein